MIGKVGSINTADKVFIAIAGAVSLAVFISSLTALTCLISTLINS